MEIESPERYTVKYEERAIRGEDKRMASGLGREGRSSREKAGEARSYY